jgi:hypothetical protein
MMSVNEASSLHNKLSEMQRHGGGGSGGGSFHIHDDIVELKSKLAVETSLKERAEMREASERMERYIEWLIYVIL